MQASGPHEPCAQPAHAHEAFRMSHLLFSHQFTAETGLQEKGPHEPYLQPLLACQALLMQYDQVCGPRQARKELAENYQKLCWLYNPGWSWQGALPAPQPS